MTRTTRRNFLKLTGSALAFPAPALAQGPGPRVVVIGGGFGGAACARALKKANAKIAVTLVEANATYSACPMANAVLGGIRELSVQQFGYSRLAATGVTVTIQAATDIDSAARSVTLADGTQLPYDRLVLSPGIALKLDALPGYSAATVEAMPHAWTDGAQVIALRKQIEAMPDGGTVVISSPANPARCPPGPYERASMIAWYLKNNKPRSKIIVLDAKERFSMQPQFQKAWSELYPGMIEWHGVPDGGTVTSVDVAKKIFKTDFDEVKADVGNVIPAQKAGAIADIAHVTDRTGWCPVNPLTFESLLQPNIHVIGDAAIAGAMPKSASAATSEGAICADAIVALLDGKTPALPKLVSLCYSLIAPDYAISITGTYQPTDGQFLEIDGTGITSPVDAPRARRQQEAASADEWFKKITEATFG
jgi:NADPH-dependent 2,4-dienoyl-CoA reductase/sulfur reductase-like enzyme